MKLTSCIATFALLLSSTIAGAQEVRPVRQSDGMPRASRMEQAHTAQLSARFLQQATNPGSLQADFTCETSAAEVPVWTENFDDGADGWTFDNSEYFSWTTKKIESTETTNRDFAAIDPNDVQSLYIEGSYRIYERDTASATGPLVTIPRNGRLTAYIGFTLNFSEDCTLYIQVGDGDTWHTVWSSHDETGDRPWAWRPVSVDLSAYAGQEVRVRFFYGGAEDYENLGYMGDFAIDGLQISGAAAVESVSVRTGEPVRFLDLSTGEPTSWQWAFPGGTPSASTEQSPTVYYTQDGMYDVTLTVANADGTHSTTRTGFVQVTGDAPVAAILPPATFRYESTRLPMVAPLAPVTYHDASTHYPTSWQWTFTGDNPDPAVLTTSTEANPTVTYDYQHQQEVLLEVANEHGSSTAEASVSVEYEGFITNLQPGDGLFTFDLDGYGEFPGTNSFGMTEFAEKFSKPSRPILVSGVSVYFTAATATSVADQIADISVALHTSENGLPGEQVDFMSWRVFELEQSSGSSLVGTDFEFTKPLVVDDEFFIVVSGFPEKNDSVKVAFATAQFRDQGNTAYFKKDGEWQAAADYFPAGENHTSYAVFPYVQHSVMAPLVETPLAVGAQGGTVQLPFFSYFGYETPVASSAGWCRVTGTPNGLTVDTLDIAIDPLPAGQTERTATLTLTDGIGQAQVDIFQTANPPSGQSAVQAGELTVYPAPFADRLTISLPAGAEAVSVTDATGRTVLHQAVTPGQGELALPTNHWNAGLYFVQVRQGTHAYTAKAVKQ